MKLFGNILIVDDDIEILRLIEISLKKSGHTVVTASNWQQVVDRITQFSQTGEHFDVIVLDVMMPGRSGYDVLRSLKVIMTPMPKVIMLTALGGIDDAVKALELGADKYLTKPTSSEKLNKAVREVMSGASRSRF